MKLEDQIVEVFNESYFIKNSFICNNVEKLIEVINKIIMTIKSGNKILIFGNGGSASDSQHMASEFVNRLKIDRSPLPAISLTTDTSIITSIGNDYSFSEIFSRQVRAIGKPGDIAFGITTSGNSINIIKAFEEAKKIGLFTVCLTGNNGGKINDISDLSLIVSSNNTQRIQETHIMIIHIICELVEKYFSEGYFKI